jgi:hypothetical protein
MANQTGTATKQRAKKTIIKEDLYDRYEITGTNVKGELFVLKSATFSASETCTLTKA